VPVSHASRHLKSTNNAPMPHFKKKGGLNNPIVTTEMVFRIMR
jgi:hypothetical protein